PILTTILLFLLRLISAQSLPDTIQLEELCSLAESRTLSVLQAERNQQLAALDLGIYRSQTKPRLDLFANLPNYFSSFNETVQPDGTVAFRPVTINNSFAQLQLSQAIVATGGTLSLSTNLQRFDDFENDLSNYNGSPIRLRLVQPIFGFNRWKWDRQILPAAAEENEAIYRAQIQEARQQATRLFFQLLVAEQDRLIAQGNQAANDRLYKIAQERFELGKINRGDLVQLELELAASEQNLIRADRAVANASLAIYSLLGETYTGARLVPTQPGLATGSLNVNVADALKKSLTRRPEVLTNARRLLEARRDVEQTKRNFGPQINLTASVGLVRSDPKLEPIYSDPQTEQVLSLNLSVPIVDWGERKQVIKQNETQLEFVMTQNERDIRDLESQVNLVVNQWNALGDELALADRIRTLAEERFRISSESYLLGSIPLTELTLAQQNRDQLARAYLNTLQTYWLTYSELQRLMVLE
ncbi:MAG: TolC family protein, partial [Bacteroidota bacterium]